MLSEFIHLNNVPPPAGMEAAALIEIPSGDRDNVWIECGKLTIPANQDVVRQVRVELRNSFAEEIAADDPDDMHAYSFEHDMLIRTIGYLLSDITSLPIGKVLTFSVIDPTTDNRYSVDLASESIVRLP
jgi:hypothetical protein